MNERLSNQIKQQEGLRLNPYRDSLNVLTVGYGRNLESMKIDIQQAEKWLVEDIKFASLMVSRTLRTSFYNMNRARQDVLVNMCFNMGITSLLTFKKMREALENGDYSLAADEMLKSKWADQVGNRAIVLSKQMLSGHYSEK